MDGVWPALQLDRAVLSRWLRLSMVGLAEHEAYINGLNVYPVADSDTGTNLIRTLRAALGVVEGECQEATETVDTELSAQAADASSEFLERAARAALLSACGSSGVIFAQWLAGFAEGLRCTPSPPSPQRDVLAVCLTAAAEAAYRAVGEPVEGTILTIARAAAEAVNNAAIGDREAEHDLAMLIELASKAAAIALIKTPEQLPVLAAAGVVDSGGQGLALVIAALAASIRGTEHFPSADLLFSTPASFAEPRLGDPPRRDDHRDQPGGAEAGYELQFLLNADGNAATALRGRLAKLGEALVIADAGPTEKSANAASTAETALPTPEGAPHTWHIHIHTQDVGAVLEASLAVSAPQRVSVSPLVTAHAGHSHSSAGESGSVTESRATIMIASGAGLVELFAHEGAVVVPHPTDEQRLWSAIVEVAASRIVLLPNDPSLWPLARRLAERARERGITVAVVHTHSPVQALAALAVRDESRRFDEDVIAMAEAASATRWGEIFVAARDAYTVAGRCKAGDVVALADGEVVFIDRSVSDAALALLDRLLGTGGELATVVLGGGDPDGRAGGLVALANRIGEHLRERWPYVECRVYEGGQPECPVLVGVE